MINQFYQDIISRANLIIKKVQKVHSRAIKSSMSDIHTAKFYHTSSSFIFDLELAQLSDRFCISRKQNHIFMSSKRSSVFMKIIYELL